MSHFRTCLIHFLCFNCILQSTTTTTSTSTTPKPTTKSTASTTHKISKRDVEPGPDPHIAHLQQKEIKNILNITENRQRGSTLIVSQSIHELELDEELPFVCFNKSNVAPDPKKTYGLFTRDIVPKCEFLV